MRPSQRCTTQGCRSGPRSHVAASRTNSNLADNLSELLSRFELSKLFDGELDQEDIDDLENAEYLARRFLSWDIHEETTDVMDVLQDMLDDADAELTRVKASHPEPKPEGEIKSEMVEEEDENEILSD